MISFDVLAPAAAARQARVSLPSRRASKPPRSPRSHPRTAVVSFLTRKLRPVVPPSANVRMAIPAAPRPLRFGSRRSLSNLEAHRLQDNASGLSRER